ncbi:LuxR family two component transcriptional regulator [Nocardioides albertanoniae]|uniref:LuxR family two component transcriptional regulator n=1 Tax=Nocardioides albertanoniae TaxID=1175486 RepID=A0A543ABI9_9ACTN|nr:LuxR family two component transcriptional regulator [Nocardioides albertanoniae]
MLDDHEVVRQGLTTLLDSHDDITVVGQGGTTAQAREDIDRLRPDVCVLDARLPDGSGIEVCREVRAAYPEMLALILTSYDDDEALFSAIMAGAKGYVLKDIRGNDLVEAIRTVSGGGSLLDPVMTAKVLERMRNPEGESQQVQALTPQEKRLLALIGEGLTNREIAGRMFLAEKTVKNYVSSILAKLGVQRRTQAALMAKELLQPRRGS